MPVAVIALFAADCVVGCRGIRTHERDAAQIADCDVLRVIARFGPRWRRARPFLGGRRDRRDIAIRLRGGIACRNDADDRADTTVAATRARVNRLVARGDHEACILRRSSRGSASHGISDVAERFVQ